jgi:hypothetical protein
VAIAHEFPNLIMYPVNSHLADRPRTNRNVRTHTADILDIGLPANVTPMRLTPYPAKAEAAET